MSITKAMPGENSNSPQFICRQIFGTKMKGQLPQWPDIHLDELRLLNPDTVGWIHMEGTPISYPLLKCHRFVSYYLTHNFSREESDHGAVSMTMCHKGALGRYTTCLHGKPMKDGSMFWSLTQLREREFYEEHKELALLLADGMYRAEIFAVHFINSCNPEPLRTDFVSDEDYGGWLARRKRESLYDIPVAPDVTDRVLIMTTCVYSENPEDWPSEFAVYSVLRKVEKRSALPTQIENRGEVPELLRLVNQSHPLPEGYTPELVPIGKDMRIDRRCDLALRMLLEECCAAGGCPCVTASYRTEKCKTKKHIYAAHMEQPEAIDVAPWCGAPPWISEHELGLAVDISYGPDAERGAAYFTEDWLEQNAWRFGFIQRYPEANEQITGVTFESWHYRYVGEEAAREIQRLGLALEEYLALFFETE